MQVFDPASYSEYHLNVLGLNHLKVFLGHYGERKDTVDGPVDSLVNADATRGEFLMFKCLVSEHGVKEQQTSPQVQTEQMSS